MPNNRPAFTLEQLSVIQHSPGNTVVFASPGSGKTTVLTHHLASLLLANKLSPSQVMAVTFTRQAATDLKRRLIQVSGFHSRALESIQTGTFHAQVFRFLLQTQPDIPVLLSPQEQYHLLTRAVRKAGLHQVSMHRWQSALTKLKSAWPPLPGQGPMAEVYRHYEDLKNQSHRWDFDDILLRFCEKYCLSEKEKPDADIRYLLVDEFQDTNPVQSAILQYFSRNLGVPVFVVGDDDQSIYGFRGASPIWLLEFHDTYRPAAGFHLSANFRSDRQIVQHASALIEHNQQRTFKHLRVVSQQDGVCVTMAHQDEESEAAAVLSILAAEVKTGASVAVLARTRRQLTPIWKLAHDTFQGLQYRTFHDAKGKEWDHVHLLGCVELNPYLPNHVQATDIEEERRLMYVAMTRARHSLYLHVPLRVSGIRTAASRFLQEANFI